MARSEATSVEEYMDELPEDRREAMETVRSLVLDNLPQGYVEAMNWGMISYEIPLERYPSTYNGQPLMYAALASQKNYMSLYLMCVYSHAGTRTSFEERFKASGKKLNMGKSCVRFRKVEDLPLGLIAETIASTPVEDSPARSPPQVRREAVHDDARDVHVVGFPVGDQAAGAKGVGHSQPDPGECADVAALGIEHVDQPVVVLVHGILTAHPHEPVGRGADPRDDGDLGIERHVLNGRSHGRPQLSLRGCHVDSRYLGAFDGALPVGYAEHSLTRPRLDRARDRLRCDQARQRV